METYTFQNSNYSQLAQNQEHLEELENGEIDMLEYEHQDLIDDGGILIESKRRARTICVRRFLIGVLATAVVMALFAVGMVVGRNFYAAKAANATGGQLKQNVDALCSTKAISQIQGLVKCTDICAVASCCHAPENGEEENCFNLFPDFCEDYLSCNILHQGPDIPTLVALGSHEESDEATPAVEMEKDAASMPRSPVSEACQPELLDNPESRQVCQDLCQSFRCCFIPDETTGVTCYDSNPSCGDWGAPCGNLFNLSAGQETTSTLGEEGNPGLQATIDLACDFNRFPETRAECDELCEPAECCFESPNYCALSADQCGTTYKSCKVLYDDFFEEPGAADKFYFNGGVYFAAQVERNVYDTCIASDITIQEQRRACETACEPAACCFIEEGDNSCKGERMCESFVECSILKEQAVLDLELNQDNVMADQNSASDLGVVVDQNPDNAVSNQDSVADQSKGAESGHFDEPEVPDGGDVVIINGVATQIQEIKSQIAANCVDKDLSSEENRAACMITCEPSTCCFIEGDNSCKGARFCDMFKECEVFLNLIKDSPPSENPYVNQGPTDPSQTSDAGQDAGTVEQSSQGDQGVANVDGASYSPPSDNTMEEVDIASQSGNLNVSPETIESPQNSSIEQDKETVDQSDQINTSLLLNALNEVDSSPIDIVPEQTINQDAVPADQSSLIGQDTATAMTSNGDQVITEPNEQASDSGTVSESSPGSVVKEGSEQSPPDDQGSTGEQQPRGPDNEEIFIQGEKYTKEELEQKLQASCTDLSSDVNRRACIALCEPAGCCTEDGPNSCKGESFCEVFVSCTALANSSAQSSGADGKIFIVDGHKYTEKEMEWNVRDKCALKDLTSQVNRQACADLCRHGKCCFQSGEKSCKGDTFCNAFGDCEELIL